MPSGFAPTLTPTRSATTSRSLWRYARASPCPRLAAMLSPTTLPCQCACCAVGACPVPVRPSPASTRGARRQHFAHSVSTYRVPTPRRGACTRVAKTVLVADEEPRAVPFGLARPAAHPGQSTSRIPRPVKIPRGEDRARQHVLRASGYSSSRSWPVRSGYAGEPRTAIRAHLELILDNPETGAFNDFRSRPITAGKFELYYDC